MKLISVQMVFVFIFCVCLSAAKGQSFNEEKTTMINFVKRMYNSAPFEGAKKIEGVDTNYYVVVITTTSDTELPVETLANKAVGRAIEAATNTFAEPCVKFEMVTIIEKINHKTTLLFTCEPLSEFISDAYKIQPFDGGKIIAATNCNYFISVVTLDRSKYGTESVMDRVALLKAKQQANTLFNGSTINSDLIVFTDPRSEKAVTTERIREQSKGFIAGLEPLKKIELTGKVVYLFYHKL